MTRGAKAKAAREALTHERLLEVLRYDPDTGQFWWRVRTSNRCSLDKEAGSLNKKLGYRTIAVDGYKYYAHVLAYFYMTGTWPEHEVDHRDLDRGNNRWKNLRPATKTQQRFNQTAQRHNKLGFKGVVVTPEGRYKASIVVRYEKIHLGHFDTPEEAHAAYCEAAARYAGEYAREA